MLGSIQYNSPGRDDHSNRSLNGEWVEVTNTGYRPVNLDGWTLSNRDGNRYRFDDLRLGARATVRVHTGRGHDTRANVYQDRRTDYIWSNYSDKATLRDNHGRTVDTTSWGCDRDHRNNDRGHRPCPYPHPPLTADPLPEPLRAATPRPRSGGTQPARTPASPRAGWARACRRSTGHPRSQDSST
ncbi:lamin tail domain-containing protein [Streptomyces sp. LN500]|uniref:lamin tail domain-containing protein n=1 Tax=Streptomyces sp. LN500 TaxID=3112978 RepID=UPI0037141A19